MQKVKGAMEKFKQRREKGRESKSEMERRGGKKEAGKRDWFVFKSSGQRSLHLDVQECT